MLYEQPVFRLFGDRGLLVEYGSSIDIDTNKKVRSVAACLDHKAIIEATTAYRSLTILFNPALATAKELIDYISNLSCHPVKDNTSIIEVPICYDKDFGLDLLYVANRNNISISTLTHAYCSAEYYVYTLGFTPGFPFLGGLPNILETPRLKTPRKTVAAGSVGIAGAQTGIYPITSPGGWQIIGRTPLKIFDPYKSNPCMFKPGDRIKFKSISREEYESL